MRQLLKKMVLVGMMPGVVLAHTNAELIKTMSDKKGEYEVRTHHTLDDKTPKYVNHLISEDSPYLLQHAHNPIDWYSWSKEAFKKAKSENKIIFLSIGYATCHWCHVMEEESFDNVEVAKIMNRDFVAIKVDREVQPDVDSTFMNLSRLTTGGGGWPLNVFLTPDGKAFLTDTYIDKERMVGVLPQIAELWKNQSHRILAIANNNFEMVKQIQSAQNKLSDGELGSDIFNSAINKLSQEFDVFNGGLGQSTKFPQESFLLFLINQQETNPNPVTLNMITKTLDRMAQGGFYDVVGGGFHRYSVDSEWKIPHFEKMLYNQAQLAMVYTRAYRLTKNPLYKQIATKTLDYAITVLQDKNGGFHSATDADSEGHEGTYFVWNNEKLANILSQEEYAHLSSIIDLSDNVYFEGNKVIRYLEDYLISDRLSDKTQSILNKLLQSRLNRIPPITDNKILLSWNALMVSALIEAGRTFDDVKYLMSGINTLNKLYSSLYNDNTLLRMIINNVSSKEAIFEDYAYFIHTLLDAYDQTFSPKWLARAESLTKNMNELFWDYDSVGYFMVQKDKRLKASIKQLHDDALPSPNGVAYHALIRLHNRTGHQEYLDQARLFINSYKDIIEKGPDSYSSFIQGFNYWKNGERGDIQYLYDGKIQVKSSYIGDNLMINLRLQPGWHINSHTPFHDDLIGTKLINNKPKDWKLTKPKFPDGKTKNLSFSKNKISVYENQIVFSAKLNRLNKKKNQPDISLEVQACSDKVCLPPTKLKLNLN